MEAVSARDENWRFAAREATFRCPIEITGGPAVTIEDIETDSEQLGTGPPEMYLA